MVNRAIEVIKENIARLNAENTFEDEIYLGISNICGDPTLEKFMKETGWKLTYIERGFFHLYKR